MEPVALQTPEGELFIMQTHHTEPGVGRFFQGVTESGTYGSFCIKQVGQAWIVAGQPVDIKTTPIDCTGMDHLPPGFLNSLN